MDLWPLIPYFAALDRLCGSWGGSGTIKRLVVIVPLTALVVALLTPTPNGFAAGALLGLAFVAVRDPEWDIWGGDLDPTIHEFWGTVRRFLISLGFLAPLAFMGWGRPTWFWASAAGLALWAVFAALLGRLHHMRAVWALEGRFPLNPAVELARGASLGLVVAWAASFGA